MLDEGFDRGDEYEHAFAIDTGWLAELDYLPRNYARLELAVHLVDFMKANNGVVLFDHEGDIEAEYRRNLARHSVGWDIWQAVSRAPYRFSSKPTAYVDAQLQKIGFDPSDRMYIGVAQRGNGIYVTHETKHNLAAVKDHVFRNCGVSIFDSEELRQYLALNEEQG